MQAAEFLADPVKVTIGSADLSASHSVSQVRMETSVWSVVVTHVLNLQCAQARVMT